MPKYKKKSDNHSLQNGDKTKFRNILYIRDTQHQYNYCVMDIVRGRCIATRTVRPYGTCWRQYAVFREYFDCHDIAFGKYWL